MKPTEISVLIHVPYRRSLKLPYNPEIMLSQDLLEMLVCPACKKELEYRQNPESLKCSECHRVYPVIDNLPIMLIDEAKIEP